MDRWFGSSRPRIPHLLSRGVGGEVADLREDLLRAFASLESDLTSYPVAIGATLTGSTSVAVTASVYRISLAGNATLTLSTSGARAGHRIEFIRQDVANYTATLVNGGVGAGTLLIMPALKRWWAAVYFDGTNWFLGPSMEQQ